MKSAWALSVKTTNIIFHQNPMSSSEIKYVGTQKRQDMT